MQASEVLSKVKGKLIVSCQALKDEPLYGSEIMGRMALAASLGGAAGIRANTVKDITEIKKQVSLPIIGIIKRDYEDSEIYITPTIKEVEELYNVGVDIIALDMTNRVRPGGVTREELIKEIRSKFPGQLIMADISTLEEGIYADKLGVDIISTTLSGYTPYSRQHEGPDLDLIKALSEVVTKPIIAEGKITCEQEARQAIECGAHAVVVGGAITRPLEITKRFVKELNKK